MHKPLLTALLLTCVMGTFGCARNGVVVRPPPECPVRPAVPAELMKAPTYEAQVRAILFESAPVATPRLKPSNP